MLAFIGLYSVIAQPFDYTRSKICVRILTSLECIIRDDAGSTRLTHSIWDPPVKPEGDFENYFYITDRMDELSRRGWTKVTSRRTIVGRDENLGIVMNQ